MLGLVEQGEYVAAERKAYKILHPLADNDRVHRPTRPFLAKSETGEQVVIKEFCSPLHSSRAKVSFNFMQRHGDAFHNARFPSTLYCNDVGQITEYRPGMDIQAKLSVGFSILEVRNLLRAFAKHIYTLKDLNLVHTDIKPANMLLEESSESYSPQNTTLIDFDLMTSQDSTHQMAAGTPAFMSPEQISGFFTSTSDVYSLGISGLFMLTRGAIYKCITIPSLNPEGIFFAKQHDVFFYPDARHRLEYDILSRRWGPENELQGVLDFIFAATRHDPLTRPQTLEEALQMLGGD